jgi:hypothetical protein
MTYVEGDPGHIDVHESIRLLFMAAGLDPSLIPDEATLGATTHISDHNKIADALAWFDENGIPGPGPATVSGTTGSPSTGTGLDGKALYTWTGNGSFTLSASGLVRLLVVSGGGGAGTLAQGGDGGAFDDVLVVLPAGTYTVTIGAAGAYPSGNGGTSSVIRAVANGFALGANRVPGYNLGNDGRSTDATGRQSDISGTAVGYSGAGYNNVNPGTFDAAYGGCPNSATVARANSGGGGSFAGSTGVGAAGRVELLV